MYNLLLSQLKVDKYILVDFVIEGYGQHTAVSEPAPHESLPSFQTYRQPTGNTLRTSLVRSGFKHCIEARLQSCRTTFIVWLL